jgi:photosystem II stability/assembly factor-like uncharacterized protein
LESAYIYEIAIDPDNSNNILVSAYEHGVNRSTDGGETWESTSGMPEGSVVYSIDYRPVVGETNIIYAAIREPTYTVGGVSYYPGGVYKSIDGGGNWVDITINNGIVDDYVYDLAIDPTNPDIIYTAMHRTGIYKTVNGGESWTAKNSGLVDLDVRSIEVDSIHGRVNAGLWDASGFTYSINGGNNWVSVSSTNNQNLYVYEVQVDPNHANPNSVYLTTATGVYLCENPSASSQCQVIEHEGKFVFDLALDINGTTNGSGYTNNLYTGLQHNGLFKSTNAGISFEPKYEGLRANIINSIIVNPSDPNIQYLSSSGRGLFKSSDGGVSWSFLNYVLSSKFINEIAFRPAAYNVIYAGTQSDGLFISNDAGQNWFSGNGGLGRSAGEEIRSQDEGSEINAQYGDLYDWMDPVDLEDLLAPTQAMIGTRASSYCNINTIGFDPSLAQNMFIGTNGYGVLQSVDYGMTWLGTQLSSGNVLDSIVDSSATAPYLIGMVDSGVKVSINRNSWENKNSGLQSSADVTALEVVSGNVYLAGTEDGIYKTTDINGPWTFKGLDNMKVTDIQVDPSDSSIVWATATQGLYKSSDSGETWSFSPTDILNQNMLTIVPIPGSTSYYIGTSGGGIHTFTPTP